MTLIIKELIIRGVVTKNPLSHREDVLDKKVLEKYLQKMQRELKKDCVETVLATLESVKNR